MYYLFSLQISNERNDSLEIENEENLNPRAEEIENNVLEKVEIIPFKELISIGNLWNTRGNLIRDINYVRHNKKLNHRTREYQEDRIQFKLYMIENDLKVLKVSFNFHKFWLL